MAGRSAIKACVIYKNYGATRGIFVNNVEFHAPYFYNVFVYNGNKEGRIRQCMCAIYDERPVMVMPLESGIPRMSTHHALHAKLIVLIRLFAAMQYKRDEDNKRNN